ncbi:MAG TPA: hypothetical protein VE990_12360 [Acidimicrobiales bacterium]|nr:hypothetical protein [Acidimicrobiales bacterium]
MARQKLIMISGAAPGLGKSSLAAGLARRWRDRGLRVELFEEDDILERAEFADLIGIWRAGNRPSLDVVLDAAARYLDSCRAAEADVYVQDALFPFLASLFAWGYSDEDTSAFLDRLAEAAESFELLQVHLVGPAQDSIPRAAAREGEGWLEAMIERAQSWAGAQQVTDLASLAQFFSLTDGRARRLLRRAPWASFTLDADRPQSSVEEEAAELLEPLIAGDDRLPRYDELRDEALHRSLKGWDFSWLRPRAAVVATLPWSYPRVVADLARDRARILDMGTGGGEVLSRLTARASFTVANEAWPPNVRVAATNLAGLKVPVVQDEGAADNFNQDGVRGRLPYRSGAFHLVSNRHEAFLASEVFRVLAPGGLFVTQQVDHHSYDDLYAALELDPPADPESWLSLAGAQVSEVGFQVIVGQRGEEHQAFADVGALIWYLRAVPWIMPEFHHVEFRGILQRLHVMMRRSPVVVRQRRFLLIARKPTES